MAWPNHVLYGGADLFTFRARNHLFFEREESLKYFASTNRVTFTFLPNPD